MHTADAVVLVQYAARAAELGRNQSQVFRDNGARRHLQLGAASQLGLRAQVLRLQLVGDQPLQQRVENRMRRGILATHKINQHVRACSKRSTVCMQRAQKLIDL